MRPILLGCLLVLASFALIALPAASASAQTPAAAEGARIVETQAKGRGPTAQVALARAIGSAVRDINASQVSADPTKRASLEDSARDIEAALTLSTLSAAELAADVRIRSNGLVDHALILDERDAGGEREVTVLVGVAVFDRRLASRKSIAVMPLRPAATSFAFNGSPVQGNELARMLADRTTERLVQTDVLTVLDRDHIDEVAKERNFVELYGRTPEELARFGKMLGADLLLVGSIEQAGLETVNETVKASGYTYTRSLAGMSVSVRLLDVKSGAITWADTLRVAYDDPTLHRLFGGARPEASSLLGLMNQDIADQLSSALVEIVSPIKVALVDRNNVWLNRGRGRLEPGMRLQVRGGEQEVLDPDTGESLGRAERILAVIEVISVDTKKSACLVVEGTSEEIRAGQVAKPLGRANRGN